MAREQVQKETLICTVDLCTSLLARNWDPDPTRTGCTQLHIGSHPVDLSEDLPAIKNLPFCRIRARLISCKCK